MRRRGRRPAGGPAGWKGMKNGAGCAVWRGGSAGRPGISGGCLWGGAVVDATALRLAGGRRGVWRRLSRVALVASRNPSLTYGSPLGLRMTFIINNL